MPCTSSISFACLLFIAGTQALADTRDYVGRPDAWFKSKEAADIAENILSWQANTGSWPKNVDVTASKYDGSRSDLSGTFDNGATMNELRFLARIYNATHDKRYIKAFERGFDHILDAQYSSGGWPQYYPPSEHYHRYITFNDDAMVRLMIFLRETYEDDRYDFLDSRRKKAARKAFDKGIECILKCQIEVDGKLTAWCAQHDERNYKPRPGRAFELVSISGQESVGIVRLLMSIQHPDEKVVAAVEAAIAWFKSVELHGMRLVEKDGNKMVVLDATAPPMWARFYEIGTNRPFYSDRDGVKRYNLDEIGKERRNGYSWLGDWPQRLLVNDYPAWKKRVDSIEKGSPDRIN